jgi:hypothetical protein
VCKIISGWNEKNLSMGGKEILLEVVAQAIPTYAMSVFKIPKGICKETAAAIVRFVEVYKWIVLALSISSDFWLRWLVHEA